VLPIRLTPGLWNFRIRVTRLPGNKRETSDRVALDSDTKAFIREQMRLQHALKGKALPNVGISLYQKYHGCVGDQGGQLKTLFHGKVGDDRTDREDVKQKFLFSNDVPADCSLLSQFVAFLSSASTFGPAVANAAGRVSGDVTDVIYRRSVLKRYAFQPSETKLRFVTYRFRHLPAESCFVLYAVDVFGMSNGSEIGVGCLD
jgi:hypothetical protein